MAAAEVEDKLRKGLTPHLTPVAFDKYFEDWYLLYKKPNVTKNTLTHYEYTLSYIKKSILRVFLSRI